MDFTDRPDPMTFAQEPRIKEGLAYINELGLPPRTDFSTVHSLAFYYIKQLNIAEQEFNDRLHYQEDDRKRVWISIWVLFLTAIAHGALLAYWRFTR